MARYELACRTHGGSRPGKAPNQKRDFQSRFKTFYELYFSGAPVYNDEQFRRRFRMHRELFSKVYDGVVAHDAYFSHKRDCTGKWGVHPLMKIIAALRVLAYGCSADSLDENLEISETTVSNCVEHFTSAVVDVLVIIT